MRHWIDSLSSRLFPEQQIFRKTPVLAQVVILAGFALVFMGAAYLIPPNGFIGFDWVNHFGRGRVPTIYPPWTNYVAYLTWPILVGLTFASVALAVLKRALHRSSAIFALLTLPLFWTVFLGQLEGLVVLGLLGLPWLAPLALLKPQVSLFAFAARRSYLVAVAIVLALSVLVWGPWPLRMFAIQEYYPGGRYVQDIALGWWGLPLALPLLWWSRGDMDMLMTGGVFATLHLLPYNLLPIVPAIARLPPRAAALACIFSWLPFLANWIGPAGWWLGWIFVVWLWLNMAAVRYPQSRLGVWLKRSVA
jgi:hypothetical protein